MEEVGRLEFPKKIRVQGLQGEKKTKARHERKNSESKEKKKHGKKKLMTK